MSLFKRIKEKIKDKQDELRMKDQILKEARFEALQEVKPELKEMYKKKEKNKILGVKDESGKKDWMKKLADGFATNAGSGQNKVADMLSGPGSFKSTDEIANMMGSSNKSESSNKIKKVKGKVVDVDSDDEFNVDEKLKRMLG